MAIIVLCSAAGSPGVSTSAVGLALAWSRPVLLLEADPTGSSAMLTGYLKQYAPNGIISVIDLAVQHRQSGVVPPLVDVALSVPDTDISLISGIRTHLQGPSTVALWASLTQQLQRLDAAGIDVLIDLGRLGLANSPTNILQTADLILLVTRSTLPAIVPAKNWAVTLGDTVGVASKRVGLLLIGAGHPYGAPEIGKQLGLPVTTTLPLDPTTAEVFHLGATPGRRFERSPLHRALPPAVTAIRKQIAESQQMLHGEGRTTQ